MIILCSVFLLPESVIRNSCSLLQFVNGCQTVHINKYNVGSV